MSEKIRVLITGATGFSGTHLWHRLETDGASRFEVFGTAYPECPPYSIGRLHYLDLRSENDVLKLVGELQPDWIFHLAAASNVGDSWQNRKRTIEVNILGTQNLLEAVKREIPLARTLFVSSAEVYGAQAVPEEGLGEEAPFQVESPYAYTKAAGEMLCAFYGRAENMDIVVARPFPYTGPGQSADFVCSDWARQVVAIERGTRPPVLRVGNIGVHRDFCDVRDVVNAFVRLLEKGRSGEVYNICSGKALALQEILDILVRGSSGKMPISIETDPGKMRPTEISLLKGSNRKTFETTDWSPEIPIEKTLTDLLAFWRQERPGG